MPSTNAALAAAGYTTAPSPSYGMKIVLKDGAPVGHYDCTTAFGLPGMREAAARLDDRLAVFDRVRALAQHTGQPLTSTEINIARRLILVGGTDPDAILAEVRGLVAA